jgi:hypothetical protein
MDIISLLLEVGKSLFEMKGKFDSVARERRRDVADYYERIGKTLEEVAATLEEGEFPHGNCEKMRVYAEQLPGTIGDVIGGAAASELAAKLMEAHKVEALFAELDGAADRDEKLAELEKAAGYFEASADSLRAGG